MEDREALKRQIELLQNLINKHKSVHGDAPSRGAERQPRGSVSARGRGLRPEMCPSFPAQTRPYTLPPAGNWRKKYSLSNKSTASISVDPLKGTAPPSQRLLLLDGFTTAAAGPRPGPSQAPARPGPSQAPARPGPSQAPARPGPSQAPARPGPSQAPATVRSSLPAPTVREEPIGKGAAVAAPGCPPENSGQKGDAGMGTGKAARAGRSSETGPANPGAADVTQQCGPRASGDHHSALQVEGVAALPGGHLLGGQVKSVGPPVEAAVPQPSNAGSPQAHTPRSRGQSSTPLQLKPRLRGRLDPALKPAVTPGAPSSTPPPPEAPLVSSPLSRSMVISRTKPRLTPSRAKSKFTWVKGSVGPAGARPRPSSTPPALNPAPSPGGATPLANPGRKAPRRPAAIAKTTKYTWVSSSSSSSSCTATPGSRLRLPRKPLSPKALDMPQRPTVGGGTRKPKLAAHHPAKPKKGAGPPTSPQAHSSQYRWKASGEWPHGGQGFRTSPVRAEATPATSSPAGFKLRSRMKIIRRRSSSSGGGVGLERRGSPGILTVNSRYALRRRASTPGRGPGSTRKAQARGLVSFGRHKLRRLSLTAATTPAISRTGPSSSSSLARPAGQRVIRTRYKIITRRGCTGPAHNAPLSPALAWRAKRVQSARTFLQSRLRSPQDRWIGGALYRVSANKLCRTTSSSSPHSPHSAHTLRHRAGKWSGPQEVCSPSMLCRSPGGRQPWRWARGRAVQRSLAIVRQARQKKLQERQYCMYYNRFGRCKRGSDCPFIHDPDKVAVCTRFLRGTCKQTDGSCTFSHKVSKEKMPVCSYFLKGICNNGSCPYSHVYVSRSAAVCQDFIRGYCPKGEKCKQKHTLLCPDFSSTGSCPRGSKCKLQHRQRTKRTKTSLHPAPRKRPCTEEAPPRSEGAEPVGEEATPLCPEKLPSFISLSSSPELPEGDEEPDTPTTTGSEVTEKKLQIKPRF
ncbi:hypothetical protein AAFF_G00124130 [Aldrovandia affinis]|uniref:Zinc finger CCCH domain-containing protein 3 n=1 Tax=Aldrovandia affinis TaxID=143900 RepID=A0AAD7RU50_9TELE|nr:hypothetical protein AAFF_G00124130 [Aldrovandia affinis]